MLCFSLLHKEPEVVNIFEGLTDEEVLAAAVGKTGTACVTSNRRVFFIDTMGEEMAVESFGVLRAAPGVKATSLAIIEPEYTPSHEIELLIGTSDYSIFMHDKLESIDQNLQQQLMTPVLKMAVAPKGNYVACYLENGYVNVFSTDFTNQILEYSTQGEGADQICWCGEDAVVIYKEGKSVTLIGPNGDWHEYKIIILIFILFYFILFIE